MDADDTRHGQRPMFSGQLAFLSNFDPTPFYVPDLGATVATAEHAFNALKTVDAGQRQHILAAATPAEAKQRGRAATLRAFWDAGVRVDAMRCVLDAKFAVPILAAQLVDTGHAPLRETNWWHDQFWGNCFCPEHAPTPGANKLGELLTIIRADLRP